MTYPFTKKKLIIISSIVLSVFVANTFFMRQLSLELDEMRVYESVDDTTEETEDGYDEVLYVYEPIDIDPIPEGDDLAWEVEPLLGRDFVVSRTKRPDLFEYILVTHEDMAYELIGVWYHRDRPNQTLAFTNWVFVSRLVDGEYQYLDSFEVPRRSSHIRGGFGVADIDFDGVKDILVNEGGWEGFRGLHTFRAFLNRGDVFVELEGRFPSSSSSSIDFERGSWLIDLENGRLMLIEDGLRWSWGIYEFVDNRFILTNQIMVHAGHVANELMVTISTRSNGEIVDIKYFSDEVVKISEILERVDTILDEYPWMINSDIWEQFNWLPHDKHHIGESMAKG